MNIIVWGTGKLFQKHKEYLFQFHIVKFCDSDSKKQGNYINGIEVISPDKIRRYECSYIVIMTYAISEIYQKLIDMQVPADIIIPYNQIFLLHNERIYIHSNGQEILFDEWKKKNSRAVLVLSHEFSYSGVPVALKNMALVLRDMGYSVLMASGTGGSFIAELKMLELDYMSDVEICYGTKDFKEMLPHFKVIIAGTIALYKIVESWDEINVPILWWLHETRKDFYERNTVLPQNPNIRYLAVGNRVKRVFKDYYPDKHMEELRYCIPDTYKEHSENLNDVITVAAIGTINQRKAQDVLLEAIEMLSDDYKQKFKFIIIGKKIYQDNAYIDLIEKKMSGISSLEWIEELSQTEVDLYHKDTDVLVCASRDDPMPIVVTQSMMHGKTCIVSDTVGQAEFIVPKENGLIFRSEDRKALKEALMWIADHRAYLEIMGRNARKIYEREFSEKVMKEKLSAIFQDVLLKSE